MTEQMAAIALRISDYGYVMRQGTLVAEGDTEILRQMQADGRLSKAYL
jgi:branched-chain amino acid transport system ATP-binding protein